MWGSTWNAERKTIDSLTGSKNVFSSKLHFVSFPFLSSFFIDRFASSENCINHELDWLQIDWENIERGKGMKPHLNPQRNVLSSFSFQKEKLYFYDKRGKKPTKLFNFSF